MNKPRLIPRRVLSVITLLGVLSASLVLTASVAGEGAPFDPMPGYPLQGCYGVVTAGTGMWDGYGTITVDVPGPVVDAWLWWAGIEDDDLIINGTPIMGTLVDVTQTLPNTHPDWFLYRFDMGGFVSQGSNTFFIEGWEKLGPPWPSDKEQRNGAALVVTYERDPACLDPSEIHVYEGFDWFWFKDSSAEFASEVEAYFLEPAPFDRTLSVTFSFAGPTQVDATESCRDEAVWYTSGTGTPPDQLLAHTWPASVGINGGQLIAEDTVGMSPPCTPAFYPPATGLRGGFVGAEWAVFTLDVPVPAGAEWVAFQMESVGFWTDPEADGESGTWVGNVLEIPLATPDVTVAKDDGVTNAVPGDVLTYNIAYANVGDRFADDVVIVDTIPDRTSFVSCFTPVGTCNEAGGVVTFDLGTVAAGGSGTVQVTVALDPLFPCGDTPITNAVTISTSTPGDNPSNNADDDTDVVTAFVTVDIEKAVAPEPVEAGDPLTYTLDWAVAGNCWAENTTIQDAVPANTSFVSCFTSVGTCGEAGGVVTWNLGTITPADGGSVTFEVLVDTCLPDGTLIDNTAAITEDSGAYDEDTVTSTVQADHELFIDKVGDPSPVMKNDPLVYTILWQITGNEPANNVTICDVVPDGTTFDSATGGGVYDPVTGEVCWNLGNFCPPANGSVSFTVIVDRDLVDPAEISNTAVLCDDDPGTACDEDQEITPVIPTSEIGDFVWLDINGDAVQDPGEAGIPGVVLNLYAAGADGLCDTVDDVWLDTRTTDADGLYLFDLLLAGSYCVDVDDTTLPADVFLSPGLADPHGPIILNPELDPDEQYLDADFGYYPGGSIGDFVWLDLNGDGVQDPGEPGIADVVIDLIVVGPSGDCKGADAVLYGSTTTDANGLYLFDPVPMGTYCVNPNGYTLPDDVYASPGTMDPYGPFTLGPGEDFLDADFGYYPGGSIGDFVWLDLDSDAVQDAGEAGIAGVTVNLLRAGADGLCGTVDDVLLGSDVTDANGLYLFDPLPVGVYCVDVVEATLPADVYLSPGIAEPHGPIVLAAWQDYLRADFGYFPGGSIGDLVWWDLDADGVRDPDEMGIPGVRVRLLDPGANGLCEPSDAVIDTAITRILYPRGRYLFDPLPVGLYCVDVVEATLPADVFLSPGMAEPHGPIALGPWEDYLDADFGYYPGGRIGDFVWLDLDGDAVQDVGEPGIAGVTVNLLDAGVDGLCDTADDAWLGSKVTSASGLYLFNPMPMGIYCVDVDETTLPADVYLSPGIAEPHGPIALGPGEAYLDADFGYYPGGSIGDFVWLDLNGDAVQDAGEPGIAGVTVNLLAVGADGRCGTADDVLLESAVTDADGLYLFDPLPVGIYCVDVVEATLPADVYLSPGIAEPHGPIALAAWQDYLIADFGYYPGGSIGDFVWLDLDGDAVQDAGEAGIAGVTVNLRAAGANALCDPWDSVLDSAVTNANGLYLFDPLPMGIYCVDVVEATLPADVYLSPGIAEPHGPIDLGPGEDYLEADFGYYPGGSIGDFVWLDLDGDAVQDAGEPGIAGVTVNLLAAGADGLCGTADDVLLGSDVTDANGLYLFDPLPMRIYCVDVVEATLPADVYLSPGIVEPHGPIDLGPGEDYLEADFGYFPGGSIGDFVWLDLDGDAVQDAGEPGIVGVTVNLLRAGADGLCGTADDVLLGSDVTDANGLYLFDPLPVGVYCVDVVEATLPADVYLSPGIAEPHGPIALAAWQDYLTADFGYFPGGSIGDFVWLDLDGDAVQDAGEGGIAGVTVNLLRAGADGLCGTADDVLLGSDVTDANGLYLFDPLPVGVYCVDVVEATLPADVYLSPGIAEPHGPIVLAAWQDYLRADFGYFPGGSIGDRVWWDLDGDAVQDAGEAGIVGVTVNLLRVGADGRCGTADDVWLASDVTDANGLYLFDPLPVGVYCVDVVEATLPANVYLSPGIAEPHGPIVLDPWEDYLTADFGYYLPSSIGDFVWFDADRDGVQDAGEPGIAGVTVNLLRAGADGLCGTADDALLGSDVTDANGLYLFDLLPIGTYCVDVDETTLPEGLNLSQGSKDPYGPIVLPPDTDYLNADFGYAYPDVVIAKAVDKQYVHRYEDLTFTITVSNNGPGPAHNVVVTDRISQYLEYIRLSTTQGTVVWNSGTRTVTASIGEMDEGEVVTITITGRVIGIPTADLPVFIRDVAVVDFTGETGPINSNETETEVVYFAPGEIPEPGTMLMLGSGLLGLAGYAQLRLRRRRREG